MSNKNEIQKGDMLFPGGIGLVRMGDKVSEIKSVKTDNKTGLCTISIGPIEKLIDGEWVEDAEFEVVQPKQIENGK